MRRSCGNTMRACNGTLPLPLSSHSLFSSSELTSAFSINICPDILTLASLASSPLDTNLSLLDLLD